MTSRVPFEVDPIVDALGHDGYAIVEGVVDGATVDAVRVELERVLASTPTGRNGFEGFATKRIYRLFAKTRVLDEWAIHPVLLGVLDRVIGPCQLSAPTGIQIGPGERAQVLHHDDSIYPLAAPHAEVVLNTMWAIDDFTVENGATRFVRGSHRGPSGRQPSEEDVVQTPMPAGSVAFYTGSIWHGGGANHTDRPRLGVILEYVGMVAAAGEPRDRCRARRRRDVAGAAAGAARLQHLSAVRRLRRRPAPTAVPAGLSTRPGASYR